MAITLFADGRIERNGTDIVGGVPAFSAYTSSTYDIPTDTYTKALFQSEHFDSDSAYDTSTSTFTVPSGKGGKYQVNAGVSVDDINDGTYMAVVLYIDGAQGTGFQRAFVWSPANDKIVTARMSNVISLNAGQTVNIYVLHTSTGTQSAENYCNYFSMFKLPGV